jgi:uncharacterized membrane protein
MSEVVVSPAKEDPFVRGLSEAIGGPRGEHAVTETPNRSGRLWTAARIVLALTCLTLALHWVQKSPCRDGAWVDLKQYTNFCYTDVLALYYAEGLNQGKIPYVPESPVPDDHQVEYPVLTGMFMGLLGLPVHALGEKFPELNQGQAFYDLNALFLSAFAVATVAMILSLRRRRPWDAALFALSPALLVTATVNWDFLVIVLGIGGIWAWAKRRPWLAGVMLGLGTSAKLWPLFLLGPILIVCIRRRDYIPLIKTVITGLLMWAFLNVPIMILSWRDWYKFMELNTTRPIDWGTVWYVGRHLDTELFGSSFPAFWGDIPLVTNLALLLFLFGCAGVFALGLMAKTPPRLAQLAFLVIALFLVTSKVWSQQFTLWLLPLIVLARPKWGAFLFWQVAEVAYFLAFYGELLGASGKSVIPEGVFVLASVARTAAVITLIVLVIREIRHPELDVVRRTYGGDPDDGYSVKMTASDRSSRFTPKASPSALSTAS